MPSSAHDSGLPDVQQCYDVAGEYDYVVVVATTATPDCRERVDRLLLGGPRLKRLVTLPVVDAVKRGLELRGDADGEQLERGQPSSLDPRRAPTRLVWMQRFDAALLTRGLDDPRARRWRMLGRLQSEINAGARRPQGRTPRVRPSR